LEVNWIESLELGPKGQLAIPYSAGLFRGQFSGTEERGAYEYYYNQLFAIGERTYELNGVIRFYVNDSQVVNPVLTLSPETLMNQPGDFAIWGGDLGSYESNFFVSCDYELMDAWQVEIQVANGDRLSLSLRGMHNHPSYMEYVGVGDIEKAVFVREANELTVVNFFCLAFHTEHHLYNQSYLVVLDPPIDSIHVLHIPYQESNRTIRYLDAQWSEIETQQVSSFQSTLPDTP
jgi:hypothetical protein